MSSQGHHARSATPRRCPRSEPGGSGETDRRVQVHRLAACQVACSEWNESRDGSPQTTAPTTTPWTLTADSVDGDAFHRARKNEAGNLSG